ncbi:hypothetical protein [Streptococcus pluranimalium]
MQKVFCNGLQKNFYIMPDEPIGAGEVLEVMDLESLLKEVFWN